MSANKILLASIALGMVASGAHALDVDVSLGRPAYVAPAYPYYYHPAYYDPYHAHHDFDYWQARRAEAPHDANVDRRIERREDRREDRREER